MNNFKYAAFSFGGGVQSTALMLLIKHEPQRLLDAVGHLPDKAYFADTGAETDVIYQHLEQMKILSSIPLQVVNNGSILSSKHQTANYDPRTLVPYFTQSSKGVGMLLRKCTHEFKLKPITKAIRNDVGLLPRKRGKPQSVALWLGISIDEIERIRDNHVKLFQNVYPLIELGWNRTKCFNYCQEHGITPTKSRCFFCPFTNDWLEIKRNQPQEFQKAVEFDKSIRSLIKGKVFLHKSCKPLEEVVSSQGHLWEGYPDGFGNECSGHCGV